ncbi:hypothetical protein P7K49_015402 [Saguinus oedipus]|uniref:Uncharacterized protein n=1 Tax=Saguinus oedipus TaxID=9490 RepID=A0ABQ9V972_SAGOE|nr:hypothetical protein P7K49_015402 [Saguinus oedipus]
MVPPNIEPCPQGANQQNLPPWCYPEQNPVPMVPPNTEQGPHGATQHRTLPPLVPPNTEPCPCGATPNRTLSPWCHPTQNRDPIVPPNTEYCPHGATQHRTTVTNQTFMWNILSRPDCFLRVKFRFLSSMLGRLSLYLQEWSVRNPYQPARFANR